MSPGAATPPADSSGGTSARQPQSTATTRKCTSFVLMRNLATVVDRAILGGQGNCDFGRQGPPNRRCRLAALCEGPRRQPSRGLELQGRSQCPSVRPMPLTSRETVPLPRHRCDPPLKWRARGTDGCPTRPFGMGIPTYLKPTNFAKWRCQPAEASVPTVGQ